MKSERTQRRARNWDNYNREINALHALHSNRMIDENTFINRQEEINVKYSIIF
jgi:hypothetical protein